MLTLNSAIPAELIERDQWVLWRFETRDDKPTKVPMSVKRIEHLVPGRMQWRDAKSNDPTTWMPHRIAAGIHDRAPGTAGIGFMFAADDPYFGIDLDDCRDPETGEIAEWAADIIARFATYCEVSPSGTGFKMIGRGELPIEDPKKTGRRKGLDDGGVIELYRHGRYFAITGDRIDDCHADVADCQEAVDWLWGEYFSAPATPPKPKCNHDHQCGGHHPVALPSDAELIDRIRQSRQGAKFDRLWAGDLSGHHHNHSEADMAMCRILAWWCGGDGDAIDRLLRQSGLYRDKWERSEYAQATIAKAVASCGGDFWNPQFSSSSIGDKNTYRPTPETTQTNTPLDEKTELAPGIKRPLITTQYSPCRRIKLALQKTDDTAQQRISGFACRCHSCDECKTPWEQNHISWFGGVVGQFPEVWCLVADSDQDKRLQNRIAYLAGKHERVYYVRVPISNAKSLWLCTHKFNDDAQLKTSDEALAAIKYAVPEVPEKQRIGCSRALAYEHAREQTTGEWTVVPDQPPLTDATWHRIRDTLAEREIHYTINDSIQYERRNLDFRIPVDWTDRDTAELYRSMVDGWMPEIEWQSNRGPKAERKHLQLCGPPGRKRE